MRCLGPAKCGCWLNVEEMFGSLRAKDEAKTGTYVLPYGSADALLQELLVGMLMGRGLGNLENLPCSTAVGH
jgi:hypothetical protein